MNVNIIKWQNSDLIPKLLEIFEILKKISAILLSIKNDGYKWFSDAYAFSRVEKSVEEISKL